MKTRRFGNNDSFRHRIGSLGSTYLVETVRPSYCKSRLCKDYRFVEYFIVDRFLTARRFHCHHQKRIQLNFNTLYWDNYIKNVKCTLVQALRLCTGRTANGWGTGIPLHFLEHGARSGWGFSTTPRPLLPPGKTRYPLYRRLGRHQDRSGQVRKIWPPPGFDPRTAQAVASRYNDWATRPTGYLYKVRLIIKNLRGNDIFLTVWESSMWLRPDICSQLCHNNRYSIQSLVT